MSNVLFYVCLCFVSNIFVYSEKPKKSRCLDTNRMLWRNLPPFSESPTESELHSNHHGGIVEKIFELGMKRCCIPNEDRVTNTTKLLFNSEKELFEIILDEQLNKNFDFVLPLQRDPKSKNFMIYPYVPLVMSPGLAVFISAHKKGSEAILQALHRIIPLMTVMILCVTIIGTLYWMLESMALVWSGELPTERFPQGIINGIWWAFVTITTVGYGDFVPKTKPGRLLSVFWVFFGLVFIGIVISTVTSEIIVSITKQGVELMNEDIAVLRGSISYKYALKAQGKPHEYDTVEEIVDAVHDGAAKIALVDAMIAGHYQDELSHLEIDRIIESLSGIGVIFLNDGLKFASCIREFIFDRQQEVLNEVSKSVKKIHFKALDQNDLFINPSDPIFRNGLISMGLTLVFLILCGVGKESLQKYLKNRRERNDAYHCEKLFIANTAESVRKELLNELHEIVNLCDTFIFNLKSR